jgi:hypothetical protein
MEQELNMEQEQYCVDPETATQFGLSGILLQNRNIG